MKISKDTLEDQKIYFSRYLTYGNILGCSDQMLQLGKYSRMICDLIKSSTYGNIHGHSRGSENELMFRYFTYGNIQG